MGSIRVGGDPESYMEAPQLSGGGKGGPSFFASLFDLLGINRQTAKGPKGGDQEAAAAEAIPTTTQEVPPAPASLPALNDAESAFKPMVPLGSDWGRRYLESMKPIKSIDPNSAL